MKKSLSQVDPKGRIDVLAYRLMESFFKKSDPKVWEGIKGPVEQVCRKHLSPKKIDRIIRRIP